MLRPAARKLLTRFSSCFWEAAMPSWNLVGEGRILWVVYPDERL
jgi:hypothetical protein